jgi:predicted DCC family thiol-disulfide oxidoreductase YuxK
LGARYRPGRPDVAFFISPTGQVREGLQAFLPLLPRLPGGRAFHWLVSFRIVMRAAEWAYRAVARHRYRIFGQVDPVHIPR